MKPKLFFLLLLLTFNLTLVATATVRYVSKTGSSLPPYTSWATASDSIQKCINYSVDGDTIYVANGVYKENLIVNKEIALIGSSMDSTVIDGTGLAVITVYYETAGVGGSFENFKVIGKGFNQGACILTVRDITVKNCRLSQNQGGLSSFAALVAENIIINAVSKGFYLSGEISSTVRNCLINLNVTGSTGISTGGAATYYIDNNIINGVDGEGISIRWVQRVYIRNNLISGFTEQIFIDLVEDTVFIFNNVLMRTKNSGSNASILTSGNDLVVSNSILIHNSKGIYSLNSAIKMKHNLFWDNTIDLIGLNYGDSDRVADPMFINDTIPSPNINYDFHLQAYSPAIDKGEPNILDVDGSRSDIGMYGGPFGEIYNYQDLSPKPPRNISALVDSNKVTIRWNRNSEADTSYYRVYRDTVQNFTIDSTKLIGSPTDTLFSHALLPNGKYIYKTTCVDNQGNESNPSEEVVVNITSINDYPMIINDYLLYQNYPNPFNPSTTIGYKLKERGYVKLLVYDIKGELVSVLVNHEQDAGYYEVEFDAEIGSRQRAVGKGAASGIYLYRIEVIGEGNIPTYTEMKKMLLIK